MYALYAIVPCLSVLQHLRYMRREPTLTRFTLETSLLAVFLDAILAIQTSNASIFDAVVRFCVVLATYVAFATFSVIVYRLGPRHPLATFPGPLLAKTSKWWMVHRIIMMGGRHKKLQELHAEYGPWVRIGPNELSVNIPDAIKPIYSQLNRGPFYEGTPAKADTLITVMDRKVHSRRRQAWTKAVTSEAMRSYIPLVENRVSQLVHIFSTLSNQGDAINIDHWINLFFMDTMGDMGFSGGFETMATGSDAEDWMPNLAKGVIFVSCIGQVPWMRDLFGFLPRNGPIESFQAFTQSKVEEIQKTLTRRRDILGILMNESSTFLTPDEAAADASLIVVAATDTSVQTVITFFRYVAAHVQCMSRLQEEVSSVVTDGVMDYDVLLYLPYLDACVQEALRIMPPGPFGPPRTSGISGSDILGTWVPPNTTVHVPVYTMHRDPAFFGEHAHKYIPERWLPEERAKNPALNPFNPSAFMPFSSGYGSCVGKQLALQNIKILVATLVHKFDIRMAEGFDVDQFDGSYKEYGLWAHEPLKLTTSPKQQSL